MNPRFTISVLAMNGLAMTRDCLDSVFQHSPAGQYELILTDNGSNDGTAAHFDSLKADNVRVIHNRKNLGFIEPNKTALGMANGDLFVMLNNDCVVCPNWLEKLAEPFTKFPHAAISGLANAPHTLNCNMSGYIGPRFEYVEFSCAMLKANTFKRHGLFSTDLIGAYCEDGDTSLRMRELGQTLHWVNLDVKHRGYATSKQVPMAGMWQAHNVEVCSRRWAHYFKCRRMDYPTVIHKVETDDDLLKANEVIGRLRVKRPLSPIHIETTKPELFTVRPDIASAKPDIRLPDELRLSLQVPENPKVVVVYVYPVEGGIHDEVAERFISSYIQFRPQQAHDLYIVANGGNPTQKMIQLFSPVRAKFIVHDDTGWDIGAYLFAAREIPCDLMVFFGGNSYLRGRGWLERMVDAYRKHGPAIYGTTASLGHTPHIRTTGFFLSPRFLNEYPHPVTSDKASRYAFEHGPNSITSWMRAKGYKALMVTWDGEYEANQWDLIPNGFQRGTQSALLAGDRLTSPPFTKNL